MKIDFSDFAEVVEMLLERAKQKHPKSKANYVERTVDGKRCDECTMWRAPDGCSAVAGKIKPNAYCDWWKKSKREKE